MVSSLHREGLEAKQRVKDELNKGIRGIKLSLSSSSQWSGREMQELRVGVRSTEKNSKIPTIW